jgi:hypothetical protein
MTDIVERLRGMANALGGDDEDFLMQVVAEIERLRAALQEIDRLSHRDTASAIARAALANKVGM